MLVYSLIRESINNNIQKAYTTIIFTKCFLAHIHIRTLVQRDKQESVISSAQKPVKLNKPVQAHTGPSISTDAKIHKTKGKPAMIKVNFLRLPRW